MRAAPVATQTAAEAPVAGPAHATHREASDEAAPRRVGDDTYAEVGGRSRKGHTVSLEGDDSDDEESSESSEESADDGAWLHRDSARRRR